MLLEVADEVVEAVDEVEVEVPNRPKNDDGRVVAAAVVVVVKELPSPSPSFVVTTPLALSRAMSPAAEATGNTKKDKKGRDVEFVAQRPLSSISFPFLTGLHLTPLLLFPLT